MIERIKVGKLIRRNGAFLVHIIDTLDETEAATPWDCFDAASSLATGRRVARDMAERFGFSSFRWTWDEDDKQWTLWAKEPVEEAWEGE